MSLAFGAFPVTVLYLSTFVSGIEYVAIHKITSSPIIEMLIVYIAGGIGLIGLWVLGIYAIKRQGCFINVWKGWILALIVGVGLDVYMLVGSYPWSYPIITLPFCIAPLIPALFIVVLLIMSGSKKSLNRIRAKDAPPGLLERYRR